MMLLYCISKQDNRVINKKACWGRGGVSSYNGLYGWAPYEWCAFNPLSNSIHIQILQTGLHTFPKELVERI